MKACVALHAHNMVSMAGGTQERGKLKRTTKQKVAE